MSANKATPEPSPQHQTPAAATPPHAGSRQHQHIFVLGANHRSAPMAIRERLYIEPDQLSSLLPMMRERFAFAELFALSTCNRFELIGVHSGPEAPAAKAMDCYFELQKASGHGEPPPGVDLRAHIYFHTGSEAIAHALRVAAGLDSLVLGETQITGQFKDAVQLATSAQTIGPTLGRLTQEALATAKKVRSQTAIGQRTVSISHAAIELAQKVFGNIANHGFLIIGAGEMAQVAARYVKSYQPHKLFVANRTVARAQSLVAELGMGSAHSLDDLSALLADADIALSSTAASGLVIDKEQVAKVMKARRGRPLLFLDIAMPRDVDPAIGELDDVYVFDIDDLRQVVDANIEERRKAALEAEKLIERSADAFQAWQRTLGINPILAAFRTYLEQLVARESQKSLQKDALRSLSDKQKDALAAMLQAISKNIASDASRAILKPAPGCDSEELAANLLRLFALSTPVHEQDADPSAKEPG